MPRLINKLDYNHISIANNDKELQRLKVGQILVEIEDIFYYQILKMFTMQYNLKTSYLEEFGL